MKYRFVRSLADDMAGLMARYLERRFSLGFNIDRGSTVVVPVPLHRRRLNWRGFNQAEIIGNGISSYLKLNFQNLLVRIRNHVPQAQISDRQSRIANATGISKCMEPELVQGKTILLVDDVATTGSTLDDCARALKAAGAKEVIGFVFARGTFASDKKLLQRSEKSFRLRNSSLFVRGGKQCRKLGRGIKESALRCQETKKPIRLLKIF